MGISLEGNFTSVFAGRKLENDTVSDNNSKKKAFFDKSMVSTRMVVLSDGAFALPNHEPRLGGKQMPADNKPFLMNCLEWLINDNAYTEMRAKRAPIYALSGRKVQGNETMIRMANVALPVILTLGAGVFLFVVRKRRNDSKKVA